MFVWLAQLVYCVCVWVCVCLSVFPGTTTEVGTIAGIASAVAMALVGAISSYISYQKKKLCFGIQRKALTLQSVQQDILKMRNTKTTMINVKTS